MTVTNGLLGAGFFPQVISIILMIMILIYLIGLFRKGNVKQENSNIIDKEKIKKQVLFSGALIVTLLLINVVGMLISLGIFTVIILKTFEKMSWRRSIVFSFITMIILHLVFVNWLGLVLPTGMIS